MGEGAPDRRGIRRGGGGKHTGDDDGPCCKHKTSQAAIHPSPSLVPSWRCRSLQIAGCTATPVFTGAQRPYEPHGYPVPVASKRQIFVRDLPIGGGAPVAVQTMCKTETANLEATMEQIRTVADAGADLVRVAVPRDKDV